MSRSYLAISLAVLIACDGTSAAPPVGEEEAAGGNAAAAPDATTTDASSTDVVDGGGDAGAEASTGTDAGAQTSTRSTGCVNPAKGGTAIVPKALTVLATRREYNLYVPPGDETRARKLLFDFHGCGGNGKESIQDLQTWANGSTILVKPVGLPSPRCSGLGWGTASDVPFFQEMLKEISASYCVDSSKVFVLGFSYGGELTNKLSCEQGTLLRGTVSLAGGFAGEKGCVGTPGTFMAHAQNDTSPAPYSASTRLLPVRLKDRGCVGESAFTTDSKGCRVYTGCKTPVVFCSFFDNDNPHGAAQRYREHGWNFLNTL